MSNTELSYVGLYQHYVNEDALILRDTCAVLRLLVTRGVRTALAYRRQCHLSVPRCSATSHDRKPFSARQSNRSRLQQHIISLRVLIHKKYGVVTPAQNTTRRCAGTAAPANVFTCALQQENFEPKCLACRSSEQKSMLHVTWPPCVRHK